MVKPWPRSPDTIQKTVDTIWHDRKVKCPICATPMEQIDKYDWVCNTEHCPFDGAEFNERIHSYGVRKQPKFDY